MNHLALRALTISLLLVISSALHALEVKPRGRIHLDYAAHDEDASELGDGFRTRRARLGLSGSIDNNWSFKIEYDFAESGTDAKDVYLSYTGWEAGELVIGQSKVPFGLEELTSSNDITLIERSLPTGAFAQSRRVGIGFNTAGQKWNLALMGFGQPIGSDVRSSSADEGLGVGGRFVLNPVRRDALLVHLGIAATSEGPADGDAEQVRFRVRPESRPTGVRLVDTGNIDSVDRINRLGIEAAWQSGPFSVQGEWMQADVSRKAGEPDVDFAGWYVSGSWVVTGESRGYRSGAFRGVSPSGPGGAWEVTARYSDLDLDDLTVAGGDQRNVTLGVNWYLNTNVRFMANYITVQSDRQGVSDDPGIFLMRAQIAF